MNYASIRKMDISNGEGVGVALFVQGCHFHCYNCFNFETWDFNGGKRWTDEVKNKFLDLIDKPYIKRVSILGGEPLANENVESILNLVKEIRKRYPKSQKTAKNIMNIVNNGYKKSNIYNKNQDEIRLSFPTKNIWLYSGYTWKQVMNPVVTDDLNPNRDKIIKMRQDIIKQCDVFVDGRYVDELRDLTLHWRGSSNQRVIDVQKTLQSKEIVLYDE